MAVSGGTRREDLYDVVMTPGQDELRGLRWADLDLFGRTLTIERSVSAANGVNREPTRTGEEKSVRVPLRLVDALRRHRNHDLRHTAVTRMLKERVPVPEVLGHSDPAMTLRRYAHGPTDKLEIASDAMEEYAS